MNKDQGQDSAKTISYKVRGRESGDKLWRSGDPEIQKYFIKKRIGERGLAKSFGKYFFWKNAF